MRRRRFSERQRVGMWWVYTIACIALYIGLGVVYDFNTALIVTFFVVGAMGLVVKWLASL